MGHFDDAQPKIFGGLTAIQVLRYGQEQHDHGKAEGLRAAAQELAKVVRGDATEVDSFVLSRRLNSWATAVDPAADVTAKDEISTTEPAESVVV